jgi:hypothetical protein
MTSTSTAVFTVGMTELVPVGGTGFSEIDNIQHLTYLGGQ